jgi:hypothetical protein
MAETRICEYCGAQISPRTRRAMDHRLRYHPACKRAVDRERRQRSPVQHTCELCGVSFVAKRSDAKYHSPRCRTAAHRAR